MEIKEIKFNQGENGAAPVKLTAEFTIEEALWVAIIAGRQRGHSPHTGIYEALVDDVFNRYWEGGTDEAYRQHKVETPPIRYDLE